MVKGRSFETKFGNNAERKSAVIDADNGPGTQEEYRNFGYDTKDHAIREKREENIPVTAGPG